MYQTGHTGIDQFCNILQYTNLALVIDEKLKI